MTKIFFLVRFSKFLHTMGLITFGLLCQWVGYHWSFVPKGWLPLVFLPMGWLPLVFCAGGLVTISLFANGLATIGLLCR